MPYDSQSKRSRLIEAAAALIYERGFREVTIADIAERAQVPTGNVYYYFKARDDIGFAVVETRLAEIQSSFREWDALDNPKSRLIAFLNALEANAQELAEHGCPIGSLCAEFSKTGGALADKSRALFITMIDWFTTQFRALGSGEGARSQALHLLSSVQGACLLAHSQRDASLVTGEICQLKRWIEAL